MGTSETAVICGCSDGSAIIEPPPPVLFNADHPFHFLIRDNVTGSTLFMGRVARPEGDLAAVPEPATIALMLVASVCAAAAAWRGRRKRVARSR